jgi:O-phosphoseryl-tRNA(Sec) kinase
MLLIILCGIPCSGKSQVAVRIARELEFNHGLPTIVVDPDKIREMIPALSERFSPERESFANSLALTLIEKGLEHRNVVVSDDLNYFESARRRLIQTARKHKAKYIIVYFTVSVEVAQNRNASRGTPIPQELIMDIAKKFDQPGAKYKWDRPALVLDSEKVVPDEAAKLVLQMAVSRIKGSRLGDDFLTSSHKVTKRGRRVRHLSFKKTLDENTRRILSDLLVSREPDAGLSKNANRLRREFLNEMGRKHVKMDDAEEEFRNRLRALVGRRDQNASDRSKQR